MSLETQHFVPLLQSPEVVRYASQYSAIRSATQTPGHVELFLLSFSFSLIFASVVGFGVVVVGALVVVVGLGRAVVVDMLAAAAWLSTQHLILGEGQGISSRTS
uniref:(northern house mosquito) hypothetical protein n=1 Tax=Culex pipiens TaxID=7175 RepID=A0A8D8BN92_CULPI